MLLASGFSWFHLLPGVDDDTLLSGLGIGHHTYVVMGAWFTCLILVVCALVARMGLESAKSRSGLDAFCADESLTPRNMAELFATGIQGMMGDVLDRKDVVYFFPLIGTLFAYILTCNVQALIPGFQPPTDNVNTNVGMACIVFLLFNGVGLKRDAAGYIKHLFGPVIFIAPLMFIIEVIGLTVRPLSLSLRLTGNMFGDHTVFVIMSDLVPIGVPVMFLALGTLVCLIQAFVFSLLSTIYIALSVPHGDHDDHH